VICRRRSSSATVMAENRVIPPQFLAVAGSEDGHSLPTCLQQFRKSTVGIEFEHADFTARQVKQLANSLFKVDGAALDILGDTEPRSSVRPETRRSLEDIIGVKGVFNSWTKARVNSTRRCTSICSSCRNRRSFRKPLPVFPRQFLLGNIHAWPRIARLP